VANLHAATATTATNLVGSGSTTNAVDLATAEVNGILPAANVGNGLTDTQVSNTLTIDITDAGGYYTATTVEGALQEEAAELVAHVTADLDIDATNEIQDLGYTASPTNGIVTIDGTGSADATLTLADGTNAGLMAPADFTKLGTVAANASVSSVAMTTPTGLTVAGSPITSSGTLALSMTAGYSIPTTASQTQWDAAYTNRITSASGTLPLNLSIAANALTGSVDVVTTTTDGLMLATDKVIIDGLGTAAFTPVSDYAPAFTSQLANLFWATPDGAAGVPSLRGIVANDLPATISYLGSDINLASEVSNILPATHGGTGVANGVGETITLGGAVSTSNTLTTTGGALTVDADATGSTLTLGAGASSVSGVNTGDQDITGIAHLQTLSGVAGGSDDLGTFAGSTIADASTVKAALQSLETAVEAVFAPSFGYVYDLATIADATVVGGADVPFSNNGTLSGVTHTAGTTTIMIPVTGVYRIEYSVGITAGIGSALAIAVNGTVDASSSKSFLVATGSMTGNVMLTLAAGDVITLRNNSATPFTIDLAPSVGAQITVQFIQ